MLTIAHRVNTIVQLRQVPPECGVEIDLRDSGDRLILQHDPFSDGENFADWLAHYRHAHLILNVKSERIEHRVLELVHERGIDAYFLLDCSFPMIRLLSGLGERRIAVRFSEVEPIEAALALAGKIEWCWVDCFTRMPLTPATYDRLKASFKLCAVSPELQGRSVASIAEYAESLRPYPLDAVCTKRPDLWRVALESMGQSDSVPSLAQRERAA
ncbi:MAG: phosphatidylinositol-specific phospholipase C/glycerophosphodiester phosphodiesterase family protein [Pirellulales bacterium]